MKRQVLEDVLTRQAGGVREGDSLVFTDGTELSLYIAMGIEPLVIDKVSALSLEEDTVVARTRREEKYVCAYEDVRAVRVSGGGRSAGY